MKREAHETTRRMPGLAVSCLLANVPGSRGPPPPGHQRRLASAADGEKDAEEEVKGCGERGASDERPRKTNSLSLPLPLTNCARLKRVRKRRPGEKRSAQQLPCHSMEKAPSLTSGVKLSISIFLSQVQFLGPGKSTRASFRHLRLILLGASFSLLELFLPFHSFLPLSYFPCFT